MASKTTDDLNASYKARYWHTCHIVRVLCSHFELSLSSVFDSVWIPEKFHIQLLRVSVFTDGCEGQGRVVRPVIQLLKDRSVSFTAIRFASRER